MYVGGHWGAVGAVGQWGWEGGRAGNSRQRGSCRAVVFLDQVSWLGMCVSIGEHVELRTVGGAKKGRGWEHRWGGKYSSRPDG